MHNDILMGDDSDGPFSIVHLALEIIVSELFTLAC